jgi:hypothetical protein
VITPLLLDTFDRCGRRSAFERGHEVRSISPLGLLYAAVEASLVAKDPIQGAKDAILERTQRLEVNAGDLSAISAVRHVESMAEVIVRELRAKLGRMSRLDPVPLGKDVWQSNLFSARGELHRIILVSHLDDDSLRSFAHSWGTIGELAALERAITLTAVIIGAQRGGRRHSPWAKGFLHPVQKSLRFAPRKRDDGFTANWKACWREQTEIKAETWLERMRTDEVLEELIISRKIQYRGDDARMAQAKKEMLALIPMIGASRTSDPMRRSACDEIGRGACPFQAVCYSPTPVSPEDLPNLYRRRETLRAAPA